MQPGNSKSIIFYTIDESDVYDDGGGDELQRTILLFIFIR